MMYDGSHLVPDATVGIAERVVFLAIAFNLANRTDGQSYETFV